MPRTTTLAAVAALALALGAGALLAVGTPPAADGDANGGPNATFEQFDSEADLQQYVRESQRLAGSGRTMFLSGGRTVNAAAEGDAVATDTSLTYTRAKSGPRHSETNAQVAAIDEPDLVKTDGEHVYYSPDPTPHRGEWGGGGTKVVDVQPPGSAEKLTQVPATGKLLLVNDTLVVIGQDAVYGYDVSNPENPDRLWSKSLDANVVTGRLHDGTVYLVLASRLDAQDPCPVEPLEGESVRCTDVHHPSEPVPVDATYTALTLDPGDGSVGDRLSFVGSAGSTVYMSQQGLYVTYTEPAPHGQVALDFLLAEGSAFLSADSMDRLERLAGYDLSDQAVRAEVDAVIESEMAGRDAEARKRFRERLGDAYREYADERRHEFASTQIVKIGVDGDELDATATGSVPGRPLDQFSLDERDGHLRVATTVQPPRLWSEPNSTNDVYVLDSNLSVTGEVTGMGETERIYSVRFDGDRGYVVTFRRIDPFHVLDLSDPENPELDGELKLPGFSTYLHPLGDGRVLGIGEEDRKVKAVVFDASDPTDPRVEDSTVLPDRWSAVEKSHHAFLLDPRHDVFFLPGSEGGHVYSYDDGLEKVYTVDVTDPRRAVYVGDHLYVFGSDEVVVVNENNWTEVERQDL
jgi:uncharacterized secreted protein with C-terminal beta-propeller domain